ncbi:MAG: hypothetical protein KDC95_11500 [Planctomycetes bacterium]|nr:hypothetical protein [Planctomycetota bacterium]
MMPQFRHAHRGTLTACTLALFASVSLASPLSAHGEAVRAYGSGSPGSGAAVPSLWCNSTPRPGNNAFALEIEGGLGGAPAITYMSPNSADLTISGLRLLVDLTIAVPLPVVVLQGSGNGNGNATLQAPLPNLAVLEGLPLHFQTYVLDTGGQWLGFSATQGLRTVGHAAGFLLAAPSARIDLPTNNVTSFGGSNTGSANAIAMSPDCSTVFVAGRLPGGPGAAIFDATQSTLPYVKTFPVVDTGTNPWTAAVTPDGSRIYLANQGPSTTTPKVECFYARPSTLAGTPFPGPTIDPGSLSTIRIEFTKDSKTGYVSTLGIGGSPAVFRYDTDPASTTFHQRNGTTTFSGKFVWDARISPDDTKLYVSVAALGSVGEIAVVDAKTMQVLDWDPGAPGIQNIGKEVTLPVTPLGRVCWSVAVGPRHRYLYISVSGSVSGPARFVRVNVDPTSPDYRKFVVYTTGLATNDTLYNVLISPAGDTAYLVIGSTKKLHEIDTATMTQRRVFTLLSAPKEMVYR